MTPRALRYACAPLHARAVYSLLYAERAEIAEVVSLGHEPSLIAARVLGVDRAEADSELRALRAAGLLGEGLSLLVDAQRSPVGSPSRSLPTTSPGQVPSADAVRAALAAHAGSRRAVARAVGCSEGALRAFAAARRSLGTERLAALAAYLRCVPECVPNCVPECVPGTQFGTQSPSPSVSLSSLSQEISSLSLQLSQEKSKEDCGRGGGGLGEGECVPSCVPSCVPECVPECVPGTQPEVRSTQRPRRTRVRPEPPADTIPLTGTVARRTYEAIVSDVALAPIVRGPGDLAQRLAAICDGTSIDPAAEVIAAGAWLLRSPGRWSDGAAGLLRWVRTAADRARAVPAAVVVAARSPTNTRTDYQGRTVAGPAALPSGDVWTSERDEETEALERIRARTQPRGASK